MLCDAATKGFPILHASLGFQKLYGFSQEECFDSSCGALVGADGILKDPMAVTAAERQIGSPQAGLATGFAVMHDVMVDFVDDVVHQRDTDFPAVLTVNRRSNGQLFTCNMACSQISHGLLQRSAPPAAATTTTTTTTTTPTPASLPLPQQPLPLPLLLLLPRRRRLLLLD